jgi:hypothetical protein
MSGAREWCSGDPHGPRATEYQNTILYGIRENFKSRVGLGDLGLGDLGRV